MRALHLTVIAIVAAALVSLPTGCGKKTTSTGTGGTGTSTGSGDTDKDKLKKHIVGKWKSGDDYVEYTESGDFSFKVGKEEIKGGKYKVTGEKTIEETVTLTEDQAKALKDSAFAKSLKEPAKGENTWMPDVMVEGDKLTRNKVEHKK